MLNMALSGAIAAAAADGDQQLPDQPFFGLWYGRPSFGGAGNYRMRATDTRGEFFFFVAERTGTITALDIQERHGDGYSNPGDAGGDRGTWTIEIRPADANREPVTSGSPLGQRTGWVLPTAAGNSFRYSRITFTTPAQVTAGQGYCLIIRKTGTAGTYISINILASHSIDDADMDEVFGAGIVPGGGDAWKTGVDIANGGTLPENLGGTAAIIRGWHPIKVNNLEMYPAPNGTQDGAYRGRIGTLFAQLVYSDGQATNFGDGGTEGGLDHTYPSGADSHYHIHLLGGSGRRARMRFKVSRGTRTVDGVALVLARRSDSGSGNVIFRLESGPNTDAGSTNSNGTLIEEISVNANLFLQTNSSYPLGAPTPDILHYVWLPFLQSRTLTNGSYYNGSIRASGSASLILNGHLASPNFQSLGWGVFDDVVSGMEFTQNDGSTWTRPVGDRFPMLFRCVP